MKKLRTMGTQLFFMHTVIAYFHFFVKMASNWFNSCW
jgi:hypothetical protein